MAEERRIYMRIAAFTGGVAILYWFVSFEPAGTALLVAVTLAAIGLSAMLGRLATEPPVTLGRKLLDVATFEEPSGGSPTADSGKTPSGDPEGSSKDPWVPAPLAPLELESAPLPVLSLQPVLLALGAGAVTTGLVFGAWLWLPGAAVLAAAAWRWLVELDPQS